ncbi:MAG: methionine--tRNA ligase [Patescibacteria group bacterium]
MSQEKKSTACVYITTTLPYVNAEPHLGHALEFVRADIIARWKKSEGHEVFFNTGTDEHGQKLFEAAEKAGKPVKQYVDENAEHFKALLPALGISSDIHFIRTTDTHHEQAAQAFWKLVDKNGYIYKKNYKTKYCVGCEEEKTDSELVDGRCPVHTNRELEIIEEENYFFKFSAFGDKLLALYEKNPDMVVPASRLNEMREFAKRGLEDFSISRLKSKMSWGIPVPGDSEHVMYVWFDALVNYISTLGWPSDTKQFEKFWKEGTTIQYCGKDNTRFQSAMWQAMLIAAGLPSTRHIIINGFVTGDGGVKMSKSLGNVVHPQDLVREYGTDALRYFVSREIRSFEDSPFTLGRFKLAYNSELANGLGNLVSRIMKMVVSYDVAYEIPKGENPIVSAYRPLLDAFQIDNASDIIFAKIKELDGFIQKEAPFKKIKVDEAQAKKDVAFLATELYRIGEALAPFMPVTSQVICDLVQNKQTPDKPLFERKI